MGIGYGVVGGLSHNDTIHEQQKMRRYIRKLDQHGRKWGMIVDMRSGRHCSVIEYLGHSKYPKMTPKVMPPQTCLVYLTQPPADNPEMFIENYIRVDYDKWKADIKQAWADFTKRVHEEYGKRNIECDWRPSGGVAMRMDVREVVGADPSPLQVVLACEQGNHWALYGAGQMPKGLTPFFGANRRNRSVLDEIEATFDARETDGIDLKGEIDQHPEYDPESPPVAEDVDPVFDESVRLDDAYDAGPEPKAPKLPGKWEDFRAQGLKEGKDIPTISREWRALKAQATA